MSKLLQQLRLALCETTATTCFSYTQPRRRRAARKRDAVDSLIEMSKSDNELVEASSLWMESRSKIIAAGLQDHPIYRSVLSTLSNKIANITEAEAYLLHEELNPLLEKADSGPAPGGEFEDVHAKFVKAFEGEFGVTATHWEPVAEGLFLFTDTADTMKLSRTLDNVRRFAHSKQYLVLKKGTTDDTRVNTDARWIFIYDQNASHDSDK